MRILIKFMKMGSAAYMSHLDLMRALLRGLRAAGIRPAYSSGFNPHARISLALPLSLGFESVCEYLEVTTEDDRPVSICRLNRALPEGVVAVSADIYGEDGGAAARKSAASRVTRVKYDIAGPHLPEPADSELTGTYLSQDHIFTEKQNRKKGTTETIDIRPMIVAFEPARSAGDKARYTCTLSATAGAVLNPLSLIKSFYSFCGAPDAGDADFTVTRTDIVFTE
jgi:radical SAM-linked protein